VAWHVTRLCPAKGDPGHLSKTKSPADATYEASSCGASGEWGAAQTSSWGAGAEERPGGEGAEAVGEEGGEEARRRRARHGSSPQALERDMRRGTEEEVWLGVRGFMRRGETRGSARLIRLDPSRTDRAPAVCPARAETFLDPHFSLTYLADPLSLLPSPSISQRRRRRIARLPRSPAALGT
jgi:hypothetical protein